MTMKTLLDDAAAHATADRQIDLELVLRRAEQERVRHRATRRGGALAVLAAAVVIVLAVVMVPLSSFMRGAVLPTGRPSPVPTVTGIPATWYYAPVWTPPVTRHPMTAAVMVLSVPLRTGSPRADGRGPVLVSADAKTYAALPDWGPGDGGVTLSSDGRKVAWWTVSQRGPVVVHLLTLADRVQHDVRLESFIPASMVVAGRYVYISGGHFKGGGSSTVVQIDNDDVSGNICECATKQLGTDDTGRLIENDGSLVISSPADTTLPITQLDDSTEQAIGRIVAPTLMASPDGSRSVSARRSGSGRTWTVQVRRSRVIDVAPVQGIGNSDVDYPLTSTEPISEVKVLGWGPGGIVLQVNTSKGPGYSVHRSIRIMNPKTGATQVVSRPHETSTAIPVAVASDLIKSATPITARPPYFDAEDRSHLLFLASFGWSFYGGYIKMGLVAALALISAAVLYRRRRRLKLP